MTETDLPPTGVLVMAHGTPSSPAGIESFYTAIRRGRPPTPELLSDLVGRYRAIGGTSPLTERTFAQVEGLSAALEAAAPSRFVVRLGTKYAMPSIEEAVASLAGAGVERIIGIVLTPHQSSLGSGEYFRRAGRAAMAEAVPVGFTAVPSWHRAPGFAQLIAERVGEELTSLDGGRGHRGEPGKTAVFFTAHSLPARVVAEGDPYPDQVGESASDVARILGLDDMEGLTWGVAWQSAGRTAEPWIGPDLLAEIRRVAGSGATSVVVCPVGFVSDHLETLYDLDIEAAGVARSLGLAWARTRSLDDDPRLCALLAEVVVGAASASSAGEAFSSGGPGVVSGPPRPA